jgi:hypothetical protein
MVRRICRSDLPVFLADLPPTLPGDGIAVPISLIHADERPPLREAETHATLGSFFLLGNKNSEK